MKELHGSQYWIDRPLDSEHDWIDSAPNWIESYVASLNHPHRDLIIRAVEDLHPLNILEIGCNAGPNLIRFSQSFPELYLAGVDISKKCIKRAKDFLPKANLKTGSYFAIPHPDKSYDLVLADAVLMYADPSNIDQAMDEIDRVCRESVIIVDRVAKSKKGIRNGHVWARNYQALLKERGFKVKVEKITPEQWPHSIGWVKYGALLTATRK